MLPLLLALLAVRNSAGEAEVHQRSQTSGIVRESLIEILDGEAEMFRDGLSAIHLATSQTFCHLFYVMSRDNYHNYDKYRASHVPKLTTALS
jgi:hypothetical protein